MLQYLGPIASVVVSRHRNRLGGIHNEAALNRLIDQLVGEVEGIGDHEAFRKEAKGLIEY